MEIKKKENNKNNFYSHTNTDTLHACVCVCMPGWQRRDVARSNVKNQPS